MAQIPRRVERRETVGKGFATDPERIQELQEEAERHERTYRQKPKEKFSKVLQEQKQKPDS